MDHRHSTAEPGAASQRPSFRWGKDWGADVAGLTLLVLFVYWPATRNGFVNYDDFLYVTENALLNRGLSWANINYYLLSAPIGYYHPLPFITLYLDSLVFGRQPFGFHFTNVVLHAANVALIYFLFRWAARNRWAAVCAAAIVALHPVNVEAVAWISERKGLLAALFLFGSIGFFIEFLRTRHAYFYIFSVIGFALSLLSKPIAVYYPLALLGLGFALQRRDSAPELRLDREGSPSGKRPNTVLLTLPFAGLAVAAMLFAILMEARAGNMRPSASTTWSHLSTVVGTYGEYLLKVLHPHSLIPFYPAADPVDQTSHWWVLGVCSLVVLFAHSSSAVKIGVAWFILSLLPFSNLLHHGDARIADRHLYLPLLGVGLILASALARLFATRARIPCLLAVLLALGVFSSMTRRQITVWTDSQTLFEHTLSISSNNYIALNNLAWLAIESGSQDEAALKQARDRALKAANLTSFTNLAVLDTLLSASALAGDAETSREAFKRGIVLAQDRRDRFWTARFLEGKKLYHREP